MVQIITTIYNPGPICAQFVKECQGKKERHTHPNNGREAIQPQSIKEQAHQLVDNLPDSDAWEDVMYRIYVRQAIEAGIEDRDAGRTLNGKEVRQRFGLTE